MCITSQLAKSLAFAPGNLQSAPTIYMVRLQLDNEFAIQAVSSEFAAKGQNLETVSSASVSNASAQGAAPCSTGWCSTSAAPWWHWIVMPFVLKFKQ